MHIILNVHSSDAHFNGNCDYAIVELTPARAELVRSRVALARQVRQQDSDLYELCFFGSPAEFFDHSILDACQNAAASGPDPDQAARDWLTAFEQTEYAVVPAGVDFIAHEAQRTESDHVVLRVSGSSRRPEFVIAWTASPKNSDIDVSTADFPFTTMEELLAATDQSAA